MTHRKFIMLEFIRRQQGKTQKEVAKQLGISNTFLSNIERCWAIPSDGLKKKCCKLFKMREDELFAEINKS